MELKLGADLNEIGPCSCHVEKAFSEKIAIYEVLIRSLRYIYNYLFPVTKWV